MLGRLIPEKQILNDQLKQVQQNSLHSRCLIYLHVLFVLSMLEGACFAEVTPSAGSA